MSEPRTVAPGAEEVEPGLWHWSIHDERIDYVASAYAFTAEEAVVLVDPLPLARAALALLGSVTASCLTCGSHQRSAWRYRRELGAPVHAPALSRELEEEPDSRYDEGDVLPGGLRAFFTPGVGTTQHVLLLERHGGVAFCPDLLLRPPGTEVALCPVEETYDPDEARRSVEKLLGLEFSILCLTHGGPVLDEPKAAVRAARAAWP